MKRRKSVRLLLLMTWALGIFLSACHSKTEPVSRVEADVTFLCSEECAGRLPGSEGNQLAVQYIAGAFQNCGLDYLPGTDSYELPYTQQVLSMEGLEQTLTAVFPDGSERIYTAGVDFYPICDQEAGFSGAVTTDPSDPAVQEKVLLVESWPDVKGQATIQRSDHASVKITSGSYPVLNVSSELFDQLLQCQSVTLSGVVPVEEAEVSNVAGVLTGEDSTQALLITAHFDHLGRCGEVLYCGALDNASGTAVMLETMRLLTESETKPAVDVIFAGFNGEEMLLQGSRAFTELKLPYESVNVINLDCVGLAGEEVTGVTETGTELSAQLAEFLSSQGLASSVMFEDGYSSDHLSFERQDIPAVSLASAGFEEGWTALANSSNDTPELLDFTTMDKLAQALKEYALAPQIVVPEPDDSPDVFQSYAMDEQALLRLRKAYERGAQLVEELKPKPSEEIPFQMEDGAWYVVQDVRWRASVSAARKAFPDAVFPEALGEFRLAEEEPLVPFYFGDPGLEAIFEEYGRTIEVYGYIESKDSVSGQVQPIGESLRYMLYYRGENGVELLLDVRDGNQDEIGNSLSSDEGERQELDGGAVLYTYYRMINGVRMQSAAEYADPASPCWFALIPNRVDIVKSLADLLLDAREELATMRSLP